MKETTHSQQIAFNLASAGLGAVLLAAPGLSLVDAVSAFGTSAVFLGAMLARLGLSGAVCPRAWKARARLVVGAATIAVPSLLGGVPSLLNAIFCGVGLITVVVAVAELRLNRNVPVWARAAHRPALGGWFFPDGWRQPC